MMNSTKSQINLLTTFLGIVAIIGVFSICINTFYWSDDYAFMVKLKVKSVLENCIYGYQTWDGRFLSIPSFLQSFMLKFVQIEFVTFVWTLTFVIGSFLLIRILQEELRFKLEKKLELVLGLLFTIVFWLGCYSHISETVYWATGGVYSLDLLLAAVWILWYFQIKSKTKLSINLVLFFIFSFVMGATTQNLTIALLCLIFIDFLVLLLKKQNPKLQFYSVLFLVIMAGLLFVSLAPGNRIRMEKTGITTVDLSILSLLKAYLQVGFAYAKISIVLIVLSIAAALGLFFFLNPNSKPNFKINFYVPKNKTLLLRFLNHYKWLFVALSSLVPFVIGPGLAFPRTALFFMYFLMLFCVVFCYRFFSNNYSPIRVTSNNGLANVIFCSIFSLGIGFGVYNFIKGTEIKKFMTQREQLLEGSKGKTVVVKLLNPELKSPCYDVTEMSFVENNMVAWRRLRLEEYYGVKQIILKE